MSDALTPLVSIVIPTYNHARYLGRALQSVLDQTYINWEVIIIDNHSTDNTDQLVASFSDSRIIYLKIHNNGVIASSRNAGIREAKGEWIAFLDSDDWWTADKLQVLFDCISDKVDLIHHDLKIINDRSRLFSRKNIKSGQVKSPTLINLLLKGNCIGNSSVVVRKRLLQSIGGINESVGLIAAEDYNTWLRIAKLTERFVYLPRRLGYYFIHNQSMSQKDMSIPARHAVAEFIPMLSASQTLKLEANFRYTTGRFNCLAGNYEEAKEGLLFVMSHGFLALRIKAAISLVILMCKKIRG
jgi:glycosyltransferase involved in cell wall biosynthesis